MKNYTLYSIWNNKNDEVIIIDGTAKECAYALGTSEETFRSIAIKVKQGVIKKWTIQTRKGNKK